MDVFVDPVFGDWKSPMTEKEVGYIKEILLGKLGICTENANIDGDTTADAILNTEESANSTSNHKVFKQVLELLNQPLFRFPGVEDNSYGSEEFVAGVAEACGQPRNEHIAHPEQGMSEGQPQLFDRTNTAPSSCPENDAHMSYDGKLSAQHQQDNLAYFDNNNGNDNDRENSQMMLATAGPHLANISITSLMRNEASMAAAADDDGVLVESKTKKEDGLVGNDSGGDSSSSEKNTIGYASGSQTATESASDTLGERTSKSSSESLSPRTTTPDQTQERHPPPSIEQSEIDLIPVRAHVKHGKRVPGLDIHNNTGSSVSRKIEISSKSNGGNKKKSATLSNKATNMSDFRTFSSAGSRLGKKCTAPFRDLLLLHELMMLKALAFMRSGRFRSAMYMLEHVLVTTPGYPMNAMMAEAYRKWLLLGCLVEGKTPSPPPVINPSTIRPIAESCGEYDVVLSAFERRDRKVLIREIERAMHLWAEDGNQGLIECLPLRLSLFMIAELANTYSGMPVARVAKHLGVSTAQGMSAIKVALATGFVKGKIEGVGGGQSPGKDEGYDCNDGEKAEVIQDREAPSRARPGMLKRVRSPATVECPVSGLSPAGLQSQLTMRRRLSSLSSLSLASCSTLSSSPSSLSSLSSPSPSLSTSSMKSFPAPLNDPVLRFTQATPNAHGNSNFTVNASSPMIQLRDLTDNSRCLSQMIDRARSSLVHMPPADGRW